MKKRKFADGGSPMLPVDMPDTPAYGDREGDSPGANLTVPVGNGIRSEPAAPAAPQTFGAAFAAARRAGKSTFDWNGKKYTTEMAGGPSSRPAAPAAPTRQRSAGENDYRAGEKRPPPGQARITGTDAPATRALKAVKNTLTGGMTGPGTRLMTSKEERDEGIRRVRDQMVAEGRARGERAYRDGEKRAYAAGGSVSCTRGDGIAQRGKTKGRMV